MTAEERYLLLQCLQRLQPLMEQFIKQAPVFPGDEELAGAIGYEWADLECKIKGL